LPRIQTFTKESDMSKTIKLALVAISLGGLAPVASASSCDGDVPGRQLCHTLEAKDHVGRAIHNILNPR
jgi:hypothetical protein